MIIKWNGDLLHICGFLSRKKAIFALKEFNANCVAKPSNIEKPHFHMFIFGASYILIFDWLVTGV